MQISNNTRNPGAIPTSDTLQWFVHGPRRVYMSHKGYIINGKRYHTFDMERTTQGYGVSVDAETICRSSSRDTAHVRANVSYFGIIREIILLDFHTFRLPVFRCDWANTVSGVKEDEGFTVVNLHDGLNQFHRDPFILATQARQVFYSRENESSNWYVVMRAPPRGFHELDAFDENVYTSFIPNDVSKLVTDNMDDDESHMLGKIVKVLLFSTK